MADFNINDHLSRIGFGQGSTGKTKTDDYVNGDNAAGDHVKAAIDKAADGVKVSIPVAGKLALIFSGNSALTGLESEGWAGKMIMPSALPDMQGGVLAQIAKTLMKNGVVVSQADGVGGDPRGEGTGEMYSNHGLDGFAGAAAPSGGVSRGGDD